MPNQFKYTTSHTKGKINKAPFHSFSLMASETSEPDQPLTPAGRLFFQPLTHQIVQGTLTTRNPLDVDAIKNEVRNSIMAKHPRFRSLMVRDSGGREHWRRTEIDVDRHVIIHENPIGTGDNSEAVNEFVADLSVSSALPSDKPLWELHLLTAHDTMFFRVHHALGDGISLMSLLMSCCRRVDEPEKIPTIGGVGSGRDGRRMRRRQWWSLIWRFARVVWYSLIYVLEFVFRALWLSDRRTAVSGGDGVEMWPRRMATASFRLEDMKTVKGAVEEATINDVLFGVISCGLSRYFDIRSWKNLKEGHQITGLAMVNLRPQSGLQDMSKLMNSNSGTRWGNKFGIMLLPLKYHRVGSNPLDFVKRAKSMIDKKKLSVEAMCSYKIGELIMSLFGAKLASILNYRIVCNTTFTISNVIGPREEIMVAGNPVKHIRVTSSSLPHALTMHMVSYAGMAEMQILVAKDIIPDPKVLAKCFEDALIEMKEAAVKKT